METIPVGNIVSYHVNSANMVDYIVLTNVTGSAYIYGMMVGGYKVIQEEIRDEETGDITTPEQQKYVWYLRRGSGDDIDFSNVTSYHGSSGDMVGVVVGKNRDGKNTIQEVKPLTVLRNVKLSDFFESQGEPYVTVNGQTYRIADNVECYYNRTGNKVSKDNWLTGDNRLVSIKTYSDSFTQIGRAHV